MPTLSFTRAARRIATFATALVVLGALASVFLYTSTRSANTTYYSRGSLPPEQVLSWSTTRDGLGLPPPNFTTAGDAFVIQNTHNMSTAAAWPVTGAGSKVQVEGGGTLTANNAVTLAATSTFQIDDGGTYIHNNTGAPSTTVFQGVESFATASNFEIRNFSTAAIPAVTNGFGNLTINAPSLTQSWNQTSNLTSVKGNLTIQATGGGTLEFRLANATDYTLTIGGNLTISGGILNISNGASAAKVINLGGNFNQSGGNFTSGTGTAAVNFSGGSSFVTFTRTAGTITPANINWSIASGKTVQLNSPFTNAASRAFTVNAGGMLLAAATVTNGGAFNVNGEFRLTDGGFATGNGFTYGAEATLGFVASGSYGVGNDAYWPTTNGPANVTVLGGGITMNVARAVAGLFQYSAGVSNAGNLTLNGVSRVNPGGFASGSPTYGPSSALVYNTGGTYGRNGEWLPGAASGAGYPNNVRLSNNTTLDLPSASAAQPFRMAGSLTIDAGSTMSLAGPTPLTQPLVVPGDVANSGALVLSTAAGGDIRVGGNWTRPAASVFTPNGRAVVFNGSGDQAVGVTGGAETFNYLVVDKPGGVLALGCNVTVDATTGDALQILGGVSVNLGSMTLTMSGNGGNLLVGGGARAINTSGGGALSFTGSKTVTSASGGTLSLGNVLLSNGVNFGAGLTTVNGMLGVKPGGFVNANPPAYAPGSLLEYDNGGTFNAAAEFPAAGVQNVSLAGTTQLNLNGDKTVAGTFAVGDRVVGSTAATPFSVNAATLSLNAGTVNVNNLTASTAVNFTGAGTVNVAGNWNAASLAPANGTVNFNGAGAQAIQTANTFHNLTASNDVTLGAGVAVNGALALGSKKVTTGVNTLSLAAAASVTRTTGYVVGNLQKSFDAPASFTFDVGTANGYSPVDAGSTTGTGSLSVRATQAKQPNVSGANALSRYWTLAGAGVTTNLTFHYLAADVVGTESAYRVVKYDGAFSVPAAQSVDAGAHAATVAGVSSFSDWTLAEAPSVFGALQFSASNYDDAETDAGTHDVTVTVRRTDGSSGAVSVHYATSDGTAAAGSDYAATSGDLNWADGDAADKTFNVTVNGDTAFEPDETINLTLSAPTGEAALGSPSTATVTVQNDDAAGPPTTVYVDDDWAGTTPGADPDGAGPATNFGYDAFSTVQGGVGGVASGGTVNVAAGTYDEDVNVNKTVSLLGAGAGTTNVRGPVGGDATTFRIAASGVTVAGFTITRLGNNTTDWNNPGLNSAGVGIQGLAVTGAVVRDNVITGNRNGLDINSSGGHTVRNNVVDFNRTGFIFRNQTDQMTVVENFITNNWTVGILFLDASGGTNSPAQSARHSTFSNNNISANWYGQVVDRQTGGSLPAPDTTNVKNFRGNWWGTTSPVVTTANSAEPGYAAQIPVAYGGSATPPGGQPDIAGQASANIEYLPLLTSGTDTNVETTPGRGTNGFQGVSNTVVVTPANQQGWGFFDDSPGTGTGAGDFEDGPGTPPLGVGSAFLQVDGLGRRTLGTAAYAGTRMDDVSVLGYGSYQNNNSDAALAPSLQFDIDYDLDDAGTAYTGRLVFEPYQSPAQGGVQQNVWQTWDARAGNWYGTRATVTAGNASVSNPCQQATPCTWQQVLALFPNAGVRNTPTSLLLFKVGGPWSGGFDGNVDALRVGVNAALTTYDFEPLPKLSVNDVTLAEGNAGTTAFTFTVTLSRASDQAVTVDYATADSTAATSGGDYASASGTLTFNPGETSKQVTVNVGGDAVHEADEAFFVNLSNPSNATLLDAQGAGTIQNDDAAPAFSINDVTHAEGNADTTAFTFTVTKTGATAFAAAVDFATQDGTASAAAGDYQSNSGTLNFAPGDVTKTVTVLVNGDTTPEVHETFSVQLSNPTNAAVSDAAGAGTITNDDESDGAGQLIISEFRLRGPGAPVAAAAGTPKTNAKSAPPSAAADTTPEANDEFVELYNNGDQPLFVTTTDGSAGWAVVASGGAQLFLVPNGTLIPARGHYLGVNSVGYSLSGYAAGDAAWSGVEVPDNAGLALFRTGEPSNYGAATRLDAVGSTAETDTLYKEGAGYPALAAADLSANLEHSLFRTMCAYADGVGCTTPGLPKDTADNAADFLFADTDGTQTAAGKRLGAPGPENLGSPVQRNNTFTAATLDRSVAASSPPNRFREFASDPSNNSTFGTLSIRRRVTNNTGGGVTRLRFRVVEVTTYPAADPSMAELHARSSGSVSVSGVGDGQTCGGSVPCTVTVEGTTLEQPPAQPVGGGYNSTLAAGTVTLATPLADGASVNVQFLLGIQKTGRFRFLINIEALP
ncbi:MAG TPA: Calx-beta domain-containing protein [Pyrinomonadaceae bacterium]